ncbi:hypothetical protein HG530_007958 [Fusarium avenaceum]|nr:hypothetical protein HG530_007958 [Fusarium avenaceum]
MRMSAYLAPRPKRPSNRTDSTIKTLLTPGLMSMVSRIRRRSLTQSSSPQLCKIHRRSDGSNSAGQGVIRGKSLLEDLCGRRKLECSGRGFWKLLQVRPDKVSSSGSDVDHSLRLDFVPWVVGKQPRSLNDTARASDLVEASSLACFGQILVDGLVSVVEKLSGGFGLILFQLVREMRDKIVVLAREKVNPVDPGGPMVFAKEIGEPVVGQQTGFRVLRKVSHFTKIADHLEQALFVQFGGFGQLRDAARLEILDMICQCIFGCAKQNFAVGKG